MKQIIMTSPANFGVHYEINPWMTGNQNTVDTNKAIQQWHNLRDTIISAGADVLTMPLPPQDCPDAVFTANAGLVFDDIFISSRFKHIERQVEENYFYDWFYDNGFMIKGSFLDSNILPQMTFEGAGDALFSHDLKELWYGVGFRSSAEYYIKLKEFVTVDCSIYSVKLTDPRFYHLDTCFCPLDTGEFLWFPAAFNSASQAIIQEKYGNKMISVSEIDAVKFACNAVSVGKVIIVPKISKELEYLLLDKGYNVAQVNMDQFLRSGGACKCLTLEVIKTSEDFS